MTRSDSTAPGWSPGGSSGDSDPPAYPMAKAVAGICIALVGGLVAYREPLGTTIVGFLVGAPIGLFYYGGVTPALEDGGVSENVVGVAIAFVGVFVVLVLVKTLPMAFVGGLAIGAGLAAAVVFSVRA